MGIDGKKGGQDEVRKTSHLGFNLRAPWVREFGGFPWYGEDLFTWRMEGRGCIGSLTSIERVVTNIFHPRFVRISGIPD